MLTLSLRPTRRNPLINALNSRGRGLAPATRTFKAALLGHSEQCCSDIQSSVARNIRAVLLGTSEQCCSDIQSKASPPPEAVSKACHPAPDAGSPEKRTLVFRGLRGKPAMTNTLQRTFETAPPVPNRL
jgi:hypothetical protein